MERMERPDPTVLPDSSLIPDQALVQPPPTTFTHDLAVDEPFRYARSDPSTPPDGVLAAGTRVVMVDEGGEVSRVIDARGLRVWISSAGLHRLS
jgi:hypothetical protein